MKDVLKEIADHARYIRDLCVLTVTREGQAHPELATEIGRRAVQILKLSARLAVPDAPADIVPHFSVELSEEKQLPAPAADAFAAQTEPAHGAD